MTATQSIAPGHPLRARVWALVFVVAAAGCGSSAKNTPPPDAAILDAGESADAPLPPADTTITVDGRPDAALARDTARDPRDAERDVPVSVDSPVERDTATATDTYVPGPVEPVVVNSGNTAPFTLADGTWKVFSFDTVADRLYCLSGLSGGANAYVGTSPSVSPYEYMEKTDDRGFLSWTTYADGKYYVAVAATGGDATTSFQIADGGKLLTAGENTVTLAAPDGDATHFFYFSIAPGHSYGVSVTGDAKTPVGLGLSPLADRDNKGQFAQPFSSINGPLPLMDQAVPVESAKASLSRNYFLSLRVKEPVTLTVTIALTF